MAIETRANSYGFRSLITKMHSIKFLNHYKRNKIFRIIGGVQDGLAHNASYARFALLVFILHRNSDV